MAQNGRDGKKLKSSTELAEFDALFAELVEELTKKGINNPEIADAFMRFKEVLQYNVPSGKKTRGLSVVTSYKHLMPGAPDADLKIAYVLGWIIELMHAGFLIVDDIVDKAGTRSDRPCWHKKEKVGLRAINDATFLETTIYSLLKKYIRDKPYYLSIVELFLQITCEGITGQCLDLTTGVSGEVDFSKFTMERFKAIAKRKTSFYSLYLPVAVAMHMAGISDEQSHAQVKPILLQLGHFCQVQNDYLDCYGAGKVGTDIQDNKCSWFIVKALEIASDEQKEALKTNYGTWATGAVEKVKAIYKDLSLEDIYKQYEQSSSQDLIHLINSTESIVPKAVFLDFVRMIYKH